MADRMTVLLIDDDPNVQSLFQMALDYHNIDLIVVDGQTASHDYLTEHTPDVIVVDIFLPTTDGYKLLQAIREQPHLQACPVIATTAYYTTDTIGDIEQSGFDGFLPKPLDPHDLADYLKKLMPT
jgi:CheY-like chemotaxis protein